MDTSQRGIDFIMSFEGKHKLLSDGRYQAYLDTIAKPPVPTIYCGLTKGVKMGMVLTEEKCLEMFRKELNLYEDAVERLVTVPLNQNQFDALVSFVYNCGIGALQKSTLLKLLNQGRYETVPAQLMRWVNAGGKPIKGLVRRRQAEGALFMEPMIDEDEEPANQPAMPQRVEEVKVPLTEGAAKSPTIWTSFAGLSSGIGSFWLWLTSVAQETSTEAATAKQALSGWDALWAQLGVGLGVILAMVVVASFLIVLVRHASRYAEGRL